MGEDHAGRFAIKSHQTLGEGWRSSRYFPATSRRNGASMIAGEHRVYRHRLLLLAALGVIVASVWHADSVGANRRDSADSPVTTAFSGEGRWSAAAEQRGPGGGQQGAGRSWHVNAVQREDGGVTAKVSVPGVPELDGLTIEGQMIDRDAFGVLLDAQGRQVTTFNATLRSDAVGGSFILGNGQAGEFEYGTATRGEVRRLLRLPPAPGESGEGASAAGREAQRDAP